MVKVYDASCTFRLSPDRASYTDAGKLLMRWIELTIVECK